MIAPTPASAKTWRIELNDRSFPREKELMAALDWTSRLSGVILVVLKQRSLALPHLYGSSLSLFVIVIRKTGVARLIQVS